MYTKGDLISVSGANLLESTEEQTRLTNYNTRFEFDDLKDFHTRSEIVERSKFSML